MKQAILGITQALGLLRLSRWAGRKGLLVLTYHGVLPRAALERPFLSRNVVADDEFARQMRFLVRHYRPLTLGEAVAVLHAGRPLPERAVAVTFDDGFRNNYRYAYPVLRRYGIPATVFLTTGHIGGGPKPLWTEAVALALARSAARSISLDVGQGRLDVSLGTPDQRATATRELLRLLKGMPIEARDSALRQLVDQAGNGVGSLDADRERYGFLTWPEVQEMVEGGVEFGSHTVSHAILSSLPPERRRAEVVESKAEIESRLGRPCRLFAYPNGTEADFDERDQENLKAAGYACALTQVPGLNDARTDLFAMRRINVGQGHAGLVFAAHVSGLLPWARRVLGRSNGGQAA